MGLTYWGLYRILETFMGVDQRTGEGSKPRIRRVVSKSDRDHGTATTDNRNLGLTPAVTISRSNLSLSLYPIPVLCPSNAVYRLFNHAELVITLNKTGMDSETFNVFVLPCAFHSTQK